MSRYHLIHAKYIQFLLINYILIKYPFAEKAKDDALEEIPSLASYARKRTKALSTHLTSGQEKTAGL